MGVGLVRSLSRVPITVACVHACAYLSATPPQPQHQRKRLKRCQTAQSDQEPNHGPSSHRLPSHRHHVRAVLISSTVPYHTWRLVLHYGACAVNHGPRVLCTTPACNTTPARQHASTPARQHTSTPARKTNLPLLVPPATPSVTQPHHTTHRTQPLLPSKGLAVYHTLPFLHGMHTQVRTARRSTVRRTPEPLSVVLATCMNNGTCAVHCCMLPTYRYGAKKTVKLRDYLPEVPPHKHRAHLDRHVPPHRPHRDTPTHMPILVSNPASAPRAHLLAHMCACDEHRHHLHVHASS